MQHQLANAVRCKLVAESAYQGQKGGRKTPGRGGRHRLRRSRCCCATNLAGRPALPLASDRATMRSRSRSSLGVLGCVNAKLTSPGRLWQPGLFSLALLRFTLENVLLRATPSWGTRGHAQQTGAAGERMRGLPRNRLPRRCPAH